MGLAETAPSVTCDEDPASLKDEVTEADMDEWPRNERRGRALVEEAGTLGGAIFGGSAAAVDVAGFWGEKAPIRGRRILSEGVGTGFGSAALEDWLLAVGGVTGLRPRVALVEPLVFLLAVEVDLIADADKSSPDWAAGPSGSGLMVIGGDRRLLAGCLVRRGLEVTDAGRGTSTTSSTVPLIADVDTL